jgi:hypothetical protein
MKEGEGMKGVEGVKGDKLSRRVETYLSSKEEVLCCVVVE